MMSSTLTTFPRIELASRCGSSLLTVLAFVALGCTGDDGQDQSAAGGGTASGGSGPGSTTTAEGSGGTKGTASSTGADDDGGTDETSTVDGSTVDEGADEGTDETGGTSDDGGDGSSTGEQGHQCDVDVVCTGDTLWSRQHGNTDDAHSSEWITTVATAPDGTSIIAGTVSGSLDFGDAGSIVGANAGFIAKIDTDGGVVWATALQGADGLSVRAADLDAAGNVAVTGFVDGQLDIGGTVVPGGSSFDGFLLSLDADGALRFGEIYPSDDLNGFYDVAVHPDGNIAVIGYFDAAINLGDSQLQATANSEDAIVGLFDSEGGHVWSRRYGDAGAQRGDGVTFDEAGNVVVAVRNASTIDFGGLPHPTDGWWAIALAKLAAEDGQRVWSRQFDDTLSVAAGIPRVEADAEAIYLGTYGSSPTGHSIDFGVGAEDASFYLAKFAHDGDTQWSRGFDSHQGVTAIEPDGAGSVLVAGVLQGTDDFGGVELESFMGSHDAFVAKYDSDSGALYWVRAIGDANQQHNVQQGTGVGTDAAGNVYFGGGFFGAVDFGDGQLLASNGFGGVDGFFAKLAP
ncbi:MAG: hypothetical protein AAF721_23465 [Myxococcota bacterium]